MAGPTDHKMASIKHHDEYYLTGGDLVFLVENKLFRVHKYFFERESKFFKHSLASPASPGLPPKGTTDATAIVLEDVRVMEMERFLWVFYNPKYSLYETSVQEWIFILDLAYRWEFPEVKALVVREIERLHMSAVDRISTYQRYEIDRTLLLHCLAELCSREYPLTLEEGRKLGLDTALTIAQARECARSNIADSGGRSPLPKDVRNEDIVSLIKEMFNISHVPASPTVQGTPGVYSRPITPVQEQYAAKNDTPKKTTLQSPPKKSGAEPKTSFISAAPAGTPMPTTTPTDDLFGLKGFKDIDASSVPLPETPIKTDLATLEPLGREATASPIGKKGRKSRA